MRLKTKVTLTFIICFIIGLVLLCFLWIPAVYNENKEKLEKEYRTKLNLIVYQIDDYIENIDHTIDILFSRNIQLLNEENNYTDYLNLHEEDFNYSPNSDEVFLIEQIKNIKASNTRIDYMYIALPDGSLISDIPIIDPKIDENDEYDPRSSTWYERATDKPNTTVATNIYEREYKLPKSDDNYNANYALTISKAYTDESGELICVIAVDINLIDFSDMFNIYEHEDISSLIVFMSDSMLIVNREEGYTLITDMSKILLREKMINLDPDDSMVNLVRGQKRLQLKSNETSLDWSLFYQITITTINSIVIKSSYPILILFSILFLLIIVVMLIFLNKQFLQPINKLSETVTSISNTNDLSKLVKYKGNDELSDLAIAFNKMINNLRNNTLNLENIITHRTKEIKNREISYRNLFEHSSDAIAVIDIETRRIIDCNENFIKLFKEKSKENVVGRMPIEFAPEYQPDGKLSQTLSNINFETTLKKKYNSFDFCYMKSDGEYFYSHVGASVLLYNDKKVIQANIQDITMQVETTNALKHSQEEMSLILKSITEGIIGVNSNGEATFINDTALTILGFERDELIGHDVHEMIHYSHLDGSEYLPSNCPMTKSYMFGESHSINKEILWKKDGTYFDVEYTSVPIIQDGEIKGSVIVFKDISEEKRIEEKIRQSELILSLATTSANIGMFNFYPKDNTVEVNTIWATQLGYEPNELRINNNKWSKLINGTQTWIDLLHPDDFEKAEELLTNYLSGKALEYKAEFRMRAKDGSYRWILAIGKECMQNEENEIIQMMGVHILIDDMKNAQREIEIARDNAEKASKVKSEFLANMSHEIRTPMNAVIGLNELMNSTNLTIKQKDYVNKIDKSAKNLLNIINDILDFSKLESGKLSIESIEFNLENVLIDLYTITSLSAHEKNIGFSLNYNPKVPYYLISDPLRLGQALLNLTTNAIKFTEHGEVSINVNWINFDDKIELIFDIIDTGIGMTAEQLDKLFNSFHQADASISRKYGGTGLGLVITKNIINLLGGSITVTSEYGKGSTFSFKLLLDKSKAIPISAENETSNIVELQANENIYPDGYEKVIGAKILIVEDNLINQQVAKEMLELEGFFIEIADNGKMAVEKIENNEYDLILMDLQMPVMGGYEASRIIRSKGYDKLPIVALSADAISGIRERVLDGKMNDYLSKPIDKVKLFKILTKWIEPKDREVNVITKSNETAIDTKYLIDTLVDIDVENGLQRLSGNIQLFIRLLSNFKDNHSNFFIELKGSLLTKNIDEAKKNVHMLKGVTGNLGAKKLYSLMVMIEEKLNNNDNTNLHTLINNAQELLVRMNQQINQIVGANNSINHITQNKYIEHDDLIYKLELLLNSLKENHTTAEIYCDDLLELNHDIYTKAILQSIKKDICDFEFDEAISVCKNLIDIKNNTY